jgi:multidrug efflux pump subunit AcrA (membrane-fusion protein)
MKRNLIIGAGVVVVLLITFFVVKGNKSPETADIIASVKTGPFKVEIETTGELEAKNSVKIMGPAGLRDFRIFNTTIQNIVEEGTVVTKGEWVATLDQSEFQTKLNEKKIELDRENAEYIQTELDTMLELRAARDALINLRYAVEEKEIIYEQSKFEPPATIKQAEINVERAKREYSQALENYKIRKRKNAAKMREQAAELRKVQNEHDAMMKAIIGFRILAPESGMVIYHKNPWDQKPLKAGSQINLWDPTVATLPDMTTMMSKTYVNEVDVRKVKPGQKVEVGLDAYPDKKLVGSVTRVANVGEQRPNSDAKVFEVSVEIEGTDPTIRPSMTTSNKIITNLIDSALFVPLECLHSHFDTVTYVFKREGLNIVKQEVVMGETNSNDAVIVSGLSTGDRVYVSLPSGQDDKDIELLPEMNGKRKKQEEEKPLEPEMKPANLGRAGRPGPPTR